MKFPKAIIILVIFRFSLHAELIISDAVFAYDFENIPGNTIISVIGPNATKTNNISVGNVNPLRQSSTSHLLAPSGSDFATVDTNSQLLNPISKLSFSIFYNANGDNGDETGHQARFLSSFNGTGFPSNEFVFTSFETSPTTRGFYVNIGGAKAFSTDLTVSQDSNWHHAGFVFQGGPTDGTVTFYFDGTQLGDSVNLPGANSIPSQTFNWFLVEDALNISVLDEYFDSGGYDEGALWYRDLSAAEMNGLFTQGFDAPMPIPEPSIKIARDGAESFVITYSGILQCSDNLVDWFDLSPQQASPWTFVPVEPSKFFRARIP